MTALKARNVDPKRCGHVLLNNRHDGVRCSACGAILVRCSLTALRQATERVQSALRDLMWRFDDDDEDPHAPAETAPDILQARRVLNIDAALFGDGQQTGAAPAQEETRG